MQPLARGHTVDNKTAADWRAIAAQFDVTVRRAKKIYRRSTKGEEVWLNDLYVVHKRVRKASGWTELSIRRQDRAPCLDWRHKQQIKNQLCGPECEGVEVYPAESRLVDTSNQFWLFVRTDPRDSIPVGFRDGRNVHNHTGVGGSVQRPPGAED